MNFFIVYSGNEPIAGRDYVTSADKQNNAVSPKHTHFPRKVEHDKRVMDAGSLPVLVLESAGVGPVELERGGIFVLLLLLAFGFFSILRPNCGERASELSSIKRVAANAGQATKALTHFCQTRRPHYGDILTTNKPRKNRDTIQMSQ